MNKSIIIENNGCLDRYNKGEQQYFSDINGSNSKKTSKQMVCHDQWQKGNNIINDTFFIECHFQFWEHTLCTIADDMYLYLYTCL